MSAKKTSLPAVQSQSTDIAAIDFEGLEGEGLDNVGATDIMIPRLTILQALSPQLKKTASEYIKGAEVGSIVEVGTGQLFPDGVLFVPVYYRKDYLEWAPRSSGKGLVQIHTDPMIMYRTSRNEKGQPVLPSGNYIAETAQFFGLNVTAGFQKCYIPMTSTQLKKARRWLTIATTERLIRPDGTRFSAPLFWRGYELTTAEESNSEGSWMGWRIERKGTLAEIAAVNGLDGNQLKDECRAFLSQLKAGEVKADHSEAAVEADAEEAM